MTVLTGRRSGHLDDRSEARPRSLASTANNSVAGDAIVGENGIMEPTGSWWEREPGLSGQSNPAIYTAIETVRYRLPADADPDAVVSALHYEGIDFLQCMFGVKVLCNVGLADAKRIVLANQAFAAHRERQEAFWDEVRASAETDESSGGRGTQDPD